MPRWASALAEKRRCERSGRFIAPPHRRKGPETLGRKPGGRHQGHRPRAGARSAEALDSSLGITQQAGPRSVAHGKCRSPRASWGGQPKRPGRARRSTEDTHNAPLHAGGTLSSEALGAAGVTRDQRRSRGHGLRPLSLLPRRSLRCFIPRIAIPITAAASSVNRSSGNGS